MRLLFRQPLRPLLLAALAAPLLAPSAGAVEKCKAVADKKTGVIKVDAAGVVGPAAWGGDPGEATNAFFNAATCLKGTKLKGCQLADPMTLAGKTPPDTCTVYVDDGDAECAAWISGCTPGPRNIGGLDQCQEVSSTLTYMSGPELSLSVDCPAGMVAVGGGFGVGAFAQTGTCIPYRSRRTDADTWAASWYSAGGNCTTTQFRATAICCPP
jgi:hypothetical protein